MVGGRVDFCSRLAEPASTSALGWQRQDRFERERDGEWEGVKKNSGKACSLFIIIFFGSVLRHRLYRIALVHPYNVFVLEPVNRLSRFTIYFFFSL